MDGITVLVGTDDITAFVEQVSWSGGMDLVARTLTVKLTRECRPEAGDKITFKYQGAELFAGIVLYVDIEPYSVSVEAADPGIYLKQNHTYKEYSGTPQAITKQVCAEFGITLGTAYALNNKTKVTSTGNLSAHQVIERAYEGEEKKPVKHYLVYIKNGKLYVDPVGGDPVAAIDVEIETIHRSQSIKNMVNRVIILDDKKKTGEVSNASDRGKYGTFSQTYRKVKDKNATTEAKKLLQGLEKAASGTMLGNVKCVSGKAVTVTESLTGISGKQIIKTDKHTFGPDGYTMQLEFYYE